jgi:hypothetical protein
MNNEWVNVGSSSISKIRVVGTDLEIEYRTTGARYRWLNAASEFDNLIKMDSTGKSIGTYFNVTMKNKYEKPILLENTAND